MKFIILLIVGVGYTIFIFIKNRMKIAKGKQLSAMLKNTEIDKKEFAKTLDFLVTSKPIDGKIDFRQQFKPFTENTTIGKYKILLQTPVDQYSHLFITTCDDQDFGLSLGRFSSVKKVYQYSFLIRQNVASNKLEVYSTMYNDLNEKNLQIEFASKVLESQ